MESVKIVNGGALKVCRPVMMRCACRAVAMFVVAARRGGLRRVADHLALPLQRKAE